MRKEGLRKNLDPFHQSKQILTLLLYLFGKLLIRLEETYTNNERLAKTFQKRF